MAKYRRQVVSLNSSFIALALDESLHPIYPNRLFTCSHPFQALEKQSTNQNNSRISFN